MNDLVKEPSIILSDRLQELVHEAKQYIENSQSDNTSRSYLSDWQHFVNWCQSNSLQSLPAPDFVVALYITELAKTRKVSTINRRLLAIKAAHLHSKLESPTASAIVRRTWKGIVRTKGSIQTGKAPILTEDLIRMLGKLPKGARGARDKAILLVGFAGAFRRSELANMKIEDVKSVRRGLLITLPRSKTDQEGKGQDVAIEFGRNEDTCPVLALEYWIKLAGFDSGPVFRRITKNDRILESGISGQTIWRLVKKYASLCGLDPHLYGGHSLRAGLATQAAINGASERSIMKQTRHKSRQVMEKYIRDANLFRDNASTYLGL